MKSRWDDEDVIMYFCTSARFSRLDIFNLPFITVSMQMRHSLNKELCSHTFHTASIMIS